MKQTKILILLTCIPILYFGQLSPKVNKLYQQLSQSKRAESKNISIDGHESDLYKVGENMGDAASNKELEYIAYNGHHVPKYYAMINLFRQKSKSLEKLFRHYRKSNDSVSILKGCVGGFSRLDEEMYLNIFFEKQVIKQTEWKKKWKDSMIINNKQNTAEYLGTENLLNTKTNWTQKEIDSLINKLDIIILDDHESSKRLVEMVAELNFYTETKRPYFQKLIYFNEKYSSEIIKKYIEFCSK